MNKKTIGSEPIYDARSLGAPRMFVLGVQHMFAMFGATVLVPTLTGLSVSVTLLFAGLGTLLFHLLSKGRVPAFLGSSFAFIGGYAAIAPMLPDAQGNLTVPNTEMLPYACFGVVCAGLVYLVLSALFKAFGVRKVMRFFPPIVTGPIIISIGLSLSSSAVNNCQASWPVALVAIAVVIVCNIWGKGMVKIIPILLGVIASYVVGALAGQVDFTEVHEAPWLGLPVVWDETVFGIFDGEVNTELLLTAAITIVPISLATVVEHIGDMCAISSTCDRNYIEDPGLHRTLLGDGLATSLAALFGAPANTTYGENTGVLALSKVYDPRVIRIAAVLAIVVSFCQVRGDSPRHADGHHRRRVPGALRHDKRRGRAQRGGKPRRLHQEPQRYNRRADPRPRHRRHVFRGGRGAHRRRKLLRTRDRRHSGHSPKRRAPRQGLRVRRRHPGRHQRKFQGVTAKNLDKSSNSCIIDKPAEWRVNILARVRREP